MMLILKSLLLLTIPLSAFAWGERGHYIVASMAARLASDLSTRITGPLAKRPKSLLSKTCLNSVQSIDDSAVALFFRDRTLILGHLSNIPDTSWKDSFNKPLITKVNNPNHYFGPERLLGAPPAYKGPEFLKYVQKIRNLNPNYGELKKQYLGLPSPLIIKGAPGRLPNKPEEPLGRFFYNHLGVTPFRAQELYNVLVAALKCAHSKEDNPAVKELMSGKGAYPSLETAFLEPYSQTKDLSSQDLSKIKEFVNNPTSNYQCNPKISRLADLSATVVAMGYLSHFIGDQTQPYHPTADYDGWLTGNGGIHGYFEAEIVQAQDEKLSSDVYSRAFQYKFRDTFWKSLDPKLEQKDGVARLLIWLGADTIEQKQKLQDLDSKFALITPSDSLELGDHSFNYPKGILKKAKRKSPWIPKVHLAFRPLIVEQLAKGVVVLAKTWLTAWEQAGRPDLRGIDSIALPYPLDPPFIWPAFESDIYEPIRDK